MKYFVNNIGEFLSFKRILCTKDIREQISTQLLENYYLYNFLLFLRNSLSKAIFFERK